MARTPLTYVEPSKGGTTVPAATAADVSNGNVVNGNDGRVYILVTNSNASVARNLTITPTATVDGLSATARTVALPASTTLLCGPYEVANYSQALAISGDNATDVKFQILHIPG